MISGTGSSCPGQITSCWNELSTRKHISFLMCVSKRTYLLGCARFVHTGHLLCVSEVMYALPKTALHGSTRVARTINPGITQLRPLRLSRIVLLATATSSTYSYSQELGTFSWESDDGPQQQMECNKLETSTEGDGCSSDVGPTLCLRGLTTCSKYQRMRSRT